MVRFYVGHFVESRDILIKK